MNSVKQLIDGLEGDYLEILGDWKPAVERALESLEARSASQLLWARKGSLWSSDPAVIRDIEDRLGWLDLPRSMRVEVPRLEALAMELAERQMERAVLLGMGGSSLAPEVLREVFGVGPGGVDLVVLDATDPAQIRRVEESGDLSRTVFLASSKSGTTAETRTLLEYFAARLQDIVGERWTEHFIVISDPGTPLVALADDEGFLANYAAAPDVGGRYSALTLFGLVPGALIGMDCDRLLQSAKSMAHRGRAAVSEAENPAFRLGAALAVMAQAGRDKLTLITSPRLASFGWWAEQLIAESTGKSGTGILPVEGEPAQPAESYSSDRVFVYVRLRGDANDETDGSLEAIASHGHPIIVIQLSEPYDLGGEFFRWEMATAIAGLVLGINPFDQPNVEEAKDGAREAVAGYEQTGTLDEAEPLLVEGGLTLYGDRGNETAATDYVGHFVRQAKPGDYIALMAYVDRTPEHGALLQEMRALLTRHLGVATTMGFGPRFLHSTGQLHKGGRNNGLFIQITQVDDQDLDIPGRGYSFGVLKSAQAAGDMAALVQRERGVIRVRVGTNVAAGLAELYDLVARALA
jgi:glucose-6-phosphate isomerase